MGTRILSEAQKSFCFPLRASAPRLPGGPAQLCAVGRWLQAAGRPSVIRPHVPPPLTMIRWPPAGSAYLTVAGPARPFGRCALPQCSPHASATSQQCCFHAAATPVPRGPHGAMQLHAAPAASIPFLRRPPYCFTPPHAAASALGFEKVSGVGESPGGLEEKMAGLEILRVRLVH